jgi:transposase
MSNNLTPEEVSILIRANQITREQGLDKNADVKTICNHAGISRKTGYKWAKKYSESNRDEENRIREEFDKLNEKYQTLEKNYDDLRFENEGRKLAWEIHGVDKLLSQKKTMNCRKRK